MQIPTSAEHLAELLGRDWTDCGAYERQAIEDEFRRVTHGGNMEANTVSREATGARLFAPATIGQRDNVLRIAGILHAWGYLVPMGRTLTLQQWRDLITLHGTRRALADASALETICAEARQ